MKHFLEPAAAFAQQVASAFDGADGSLQIRGPWLTNTQARIYVGCRTMKGWYEWRRRHGIVAHGRTVARADLDRELRRLAQPRPRRMAPASLANLRQRSSA